MKDLALLVALAVGMFVIGFGTGYEKAMTAIDSYKLKMNPMNLNVRGLPEQSSVYVTIEASGEWVKVK